MKKDKYNNTPDLHDFLHRLEETNELLKIKKAVNTKFEIAAIISKMDGKQAVLFDHILGSKIKVVSNIVGTRSRFCLALGAKNIKNIHNVTNNAIKNMKKPITVKETPLYHCRTSTNLSDLPIVTHFEKDAGPYITSSIVYARTQDGGNQNSSTHRLLKLDEKHMAIRMVEGRHLHRCFLNAKEHGEDLKVVIVIGIHPAINIASAYQAAYGIDEMYIANSLLNGKLYLNENQYSRLLIPNTCEIVLEGKILRDKTHKEWMVEMLKTYDFKREQPIFKLEKIRFKENAIYYDILPGYLEHRLLMGLPVEAKMNEQVKAVVPSTETVHLSDSGCNWLTAIIQIKKRLEGEPKNALLAAFAAHPSLKIAIVVDEDIDPTDTNSVQYAIATRSQPDKNFIIINDIKGSSLDPSSDQVNLLTSKLGIDATITLLKSKERFEIARIPGENRIKLSDYIL